VNIVKTLVTIVLSLALFLMLVGLALAEGSGGAEAVALRITLDPQVGPAGSSLKVNGEGASPGTAVQISLSPWGGGAELASVNATPSADGTFGATLTVPTGTADGKYEVRASQTNPQTGNLIQYWYVNFFVGTTVPGDLPPTGGTPLRATAIMGEVLLLVLLGGGLLRLVRA
jgi:hypothetical protein